MTRRPRDLLWGDNLHRPETRREILYEVRERRPRLIVMGWPCTLWGTLTNVNYRGPEGRQKLRRLRQKERPILNFFKELAYEQLSRGDHIVGENQLFSEAFKEDPRWRSTRWISAEPTCARIDYATRRPMRRC